MADQLVESFSGIRGIFGKSLTEAITIRYAVVFADYLASTRNGPVRVVLGLDARPSGPSLQKIFRRVFTAFGFQIISAGISTIPAVESAVRYYRANGGVMITASHNEPEFNGFKLIGADSAVFNQKEINKIISRVHNDYFCQKPERPAGNFIDKRSAINRVYVEEVLSIIGRQSVHKIKRKKFTLLADPNGGPAADIIRLLFGRLNVRIVGINMRPGVFHRRVEPNAESLAYLVPKITKAGADFGFGLDGDADRVELVLPSSISHVHSRGALVSGQQMVALGVDGLLSLKGGRGKKVVLNLATSALVEQVAARYGAKTVLTDVGETNIVGAMKKHSSFIGVEGSNGGLITLPAMCRDGLLSVVIILSLLAEKDKSLEKILADYPNYYEKRLRLSFSPGQDLFLKKKITAYFRARGYRVCQAAGSAGGIRIIFNQRNWLFFRASQTESGLFRVIANGDDPLLVEKMISAGRKVFHQCN